MNDMKIISECRNETVAELVDLIGVENAVAVVKYFSGTQISSMLKEKKERRSENERKRKHGADAGN